MRHWILVGILVVATGWTSEMSGQHRAWFVEANQLYEGADYEGALARYSQIMHLGYESSELYYNIGNCYFKTGDLGRSILFYERALRLDSGDGDARANLELSRSLTADDIVPLPGFWLIRAFRWWVYALPQSGLASLAAAAYTAVMLGVLTSLLRREPLVRQWALRVTAVSLLFAALFGLNLLIREYRWGQATEAIILSEEVPVQSAPSQDPSLQVFVIHEGAKVRIDDLAGEWAEIVLEDGKVGWVQRDLLEVI